MKWRNNIMKLSSYTTSVLKNFATINQNLVIKEGSELLTMSAMKNIVAKADVEETFPKEFAIYDLNEFLAALSIFAVPILEFEDQYLIIKEEGQPDKKLKYFYSDPSVVQSPSKTISMPSEEVKFHLTIEKLLEMKRAAGVVGSPDMVLQKLNGSSSLITKDKKNDTANNYSSDIKTDASGEFEFYFKVENLKLLDGDYDVKISSKNISNFVHNNGKVEYWIALEPESTYSE
tara:strand:- start:401 stop:1096 length:696 start_codon:yes stop_codon:yes gene_type:complete